MGGIKLTSIIEENSLINDLQSYYFQQNKVNIGDIVQLGTKTKLKYGITGLLDNVGNDRFCEIRVNTGARGSALYIDLGNGQTQNYTVIKDYEKNAMKKIPMYNIQSYQDIIVSGNKTYVGWPYTNNTMSLDGWIAESDQDTWGTSQKTISGTVFGRGIEIYGSATWVMTDNTSDAEIYMLSGGEIGDYSIHCVKYTDLNLRGDQLQQFTNILTGCDYLTSIGEIDLDNSKYGVMTYKHKYTDIGLNELIVEGIANVIGREVYFYNGAPIFKATSDGETTVKILCTGTDNGLADVEIKNGAFENVNIEVGMDKIANNKCSIKKDGEWYSVNTPDWTWSVGTTYELKFNVKKGITYWIKAYPKTATAKIFFKTLSIQTATED